jgi:hypothetical protein
MDYIAKDKKLELIYAPGKGSWTYYIQIPNTKDIKGKWGHIKVSGYIDNYKLENRNLALVKGEDKILSINETIRKAINKTGGDKVYVTLYLLNKREEITKKQILETFEESGVLKQFISFSDIEQNDILQDIISEKTEEKQIKKIVRYIDNLNNTDNKK